MRVRIEPFDARIQIEGEFIRSSLSLLLIGLALSIDKRFGYKNFASKNFLILD